jgi:hypothetical protein
MTKIECTGYLDKNSGLNYEAAFFEDFAIKLLAVYKHNKSILKNVKVLIYEYFYREFPLITINEFDSYTNHIGVIDPQKSKEVCKKVFEDAGEIFDLDYLGNSEWPFICVTETKYSYYYVVVR